MSIASKVTVATMAVAFSSVEATQLKNFATVVKASGETGRQLQVVSLTCTKPNAAKAVAALGDDATGYFLEELMALPETETFERDATFTGPALKDTAHTCADGSGTVTLTCKADGDAYSVQGCKEENGADQRCAMPENQTDLEQLFENVDGNDEVQLDLPVVVAGVDYAVATNFSDKISCNSRTHTGRPQLQCDTSAARTRLVTLNTGTAAVVDAGDFESSNGIVFKNSDGTRAYKLPEYNLSGCLPKTCNRPATLPSGYRVVSVPAKIELKDYQVPRDLQGACAEGFTGRPQALCEEHEEDIILSGCDPVEVIAPVVEEETTEPEPVVEEKEEETEIDFGGSDWTALFGAAGGASCALIAGLYKMCK